MSYLEILGIYVTSAGTFASILGIFFAIYAKQNGKITREFISEQNKEMQKNMQEFIATFFERFDKRAEKRHIEILEKINK